jgi:hypothetical protein
LFRQEANAGGSVLFDDLSLTSSTPAALPVLSAFDKAGPDVLLSFPTYLGFQYQVRWTDDLSVPNWQPLTNLIGDGIAHSVSDVIGNGRRFYQAVQFCY